MSIDSFYREMAHADDLLKEIKAKLKQRNAEKDYQIRKRVLIKRLGVY